MRDGIIQQELKSSKYLEIYYCNLLFFQFIVLIVPLASRLGEQTLLEDWAHYRWLLVHYLVSLVL